MTSVRSTPAVETERLVLHRPSRHDLDELFAIESDPRVWTHYPSLRHTDLVLRSLGQTLSVIDRWLEGWRAHGLDTWTVRLSENSTVIGYGGCSVQGQVWNLGYRLAPGVQGRGYVTELAWAALRQARAVEPERPIIARLLDHNVASQRVAVKLGMALAYRALDQGNPDPSAVRLIYADRTLSAVQLSDLARAEAPRAGC